MKKLAIFIVIALLISVCLTACGASVQLSTPTDLMIEGDVLYWSSVENADGYEISINDESIKVEHNYYTLELKSGQEYVISVRAIGSGKYISSEFCESIKKTVPQSTQLIKLATPEIREIDGEGRLRWTMISNADGYKIFKNNLLFATIQGASVTTYLLDITTPGEYSIQVQAFGKVGVYTDSSKSNVRKLIIDENGKPRLPAITTPQISYDHISKSLAWSKVTNAVKYSVYLNDVLIDTTTELSIAISPSLISNTYKVVANGNGVTYGDSKASNPITFPMEPENEPRNLRIENVDGVPSLVWDEIIYSKGYRLDINGSSVVVYNNYFMFADYPEGKYEVRIKSLGDDAFYSSSLYSYSVGIVVKSGRIKFQTLETPHIQYYTPSTRTVGWNSIQGAAAYKLVIETPYDDRLSTIEFETNDTKYVLDEAFENVDLIFYVYALPSEGFSASLRSEGFSYTYPRSYDYINDEFIQVHVEGDEYSFMHAPNAISYTTGKFTWYCKDNASKYVVYIDSSEYEVEAPEIEYELKGNVTICVKAVSTESFVYDSPLSEECLFEYPYLLDTPTITVKDYKLYISPIENADHYTIYYNDEQFETPLVEVDLRNVLLIDGDYIIYVVANSTNEDFISSYKSREVVFKVDYGEMGTKEKPYEINEVKDFDLLKEYPTAYFIIKAQELDFAGYPWSPLFIDMAFEGNLDGKGCVIKNPVLTSISGQTSLFGKLTNAEVGNFTIENAVVNDGRNIGVVSTYAADSRIYDVTIKNASIKSSELLFAGALAAEMSGQIDNCTVEIQFDISGVSAVLGGLCGSFEGVAFNCSVKTNASVKANGTTGGLFGIHSGSVIKSTVMQTTLIIDGNTTSGVAIGKGTGDYELEVEGSLKLADGYGGVFGTLSGSADIIVDVELTADCKSALTLGGLAGMATLNELKYAGLAKINVKAPSAYIGGVVGILSGDIALDNDLTLDIAATTDKGYVGGVAAQGSFTYLGALSGRVVIDIINDAIIDVKYGVVGVDDDRFDSTAVIVSGDYFDYLNAPPEGDGTQSSPYLIKTQRDLEYLAIGVESYYLLKNDLSLDIHAPVANEFRGVLDGDGHLLVGYSLSGDEVALFGLLDNAMVKNLIIDQCSTYGASKAAVLALTAKNSVIRNVTARATVSASANDSKAGGLILSAQNTLIERCGFNGSINACDGGGLVCDIVGGKIETSFVIGGMSFSKGGGLAKTSSADVIECYTTVKQLVRSIEFAAFIYNNGGSVTDCYTSSETYKDAIAFAGGAGSLNNCKFTSSTFVDRSGSTGYLSASSAFSGVFEGDSWDNSSVYSKIKDLPMQTITNNVSDASYDLGSALSFDVSLLGLNGASYFGVAIVTLSEGLTLTHETIELATYGEYTLKLNFVDKEVSISIKSTKYQNPDFPDGEGTKEEPYLINDITQYQKISQYSGVYFKLNADLDEYPTLDELSSYVDYDNRNVQTSSCLFVSTDNASVSNLKLTVTATPTTDYGGVALTALASVFENIELIVDVNGESDTANIGSLAATADDSTFKSIKIGGSIKGKGAYVGGLIGKAIGQNVMDYITLDDFLIFVSSDSAAGLVGSYQGDASHISGSVSINAEEVAELGGLFGDLSGNLSGCVVTVRLEGNARTAGGLVANLMGRASKSTVTLTAEKMTVEGFGGIAANMTSGSDLTVVCDIDVTLTSGRLGGLVGEANSVQGTLSGQIKVLVNGNSSIGGVGSSNDAAVEAENLTINVTVASLVSQVLLAGGVAEGKAVDCDIKATIGFVDSTKSGENGIFIVGGVVAKGSAEKSTFDGSATMNASFATLICGGIAGECTSTISSSVSKGTITMSKNNNEESPLSIGGKLIGVSYDIEDNTIVDSSSTMSVICDVSAGNIGTVSLDS